MAEVSQETIGRKLPQGKVKGKEDRQIDRKNLLERIRS